MDDLALQRLIGEDWAAGCSATRYCLVCSSALCSHCCGEHLEEHHAHERPESIQTIQFVGGAPALLAQGVGGCGYDTRQIQRVVSGQRKYVLVCPVGHDDMRLKSFCDACHRRIKRAPHIRYCSLGCKAHMAVGGERRAAVERLALLAQAGQFGAAAGHLKDRFCVVCWLAFCSWSCPAHAQHHHPEAGPGAVKTVVRVDGWVAVPAGQLPAAVVHDVQALHQPNGLVVYPIRSREGQAGQHFAPAAIHQCQRQGCPEQIVALEPYCSLRCRHQAA